MGPPTHHSIYMIVDGTPQHLVAHPLSQWIRHLITQWTSHRIWHLVTNPLTPRTWHWLCVEGDGRVVSHIRRRASGWTHQSCLCHRAVEYAIGCFCNKYPFYSFSFYVFLIKRVHVHWVTFNLSTSSLMLQECICLCKTLCFWWYFCYGCY